ncbi:MAG: hypothetical protein IK099_02970 [Clostridia bacterium]|nr:hypothetical protein [Clostridia bacterium]
MPTAMLHQNGEKSKQEKEGQQRFMGAVKTLGIAALLWQNSIRKESRKYGKEKDGSRRSAYELISSFLSLYEFFNVCRNFWQIPDCSVSFKPGFLCACHLKVFIYLIFCIAIFFPNGK